MRWSLVQHSSCLGQHPSCLGYFVFRMLLVWREKELKVHDDVKVRITALVTSRTNPYYFNRALSVLTTLSCTLLFNPTREIGMGFGKHRRACSSLWPEDLSGDATATSGRAPCRIVNRRTGLALLARSCCRTASNL